MNRGALTILAVIWICSLPRVAWTQSFGVELRNTLMPASGGMGGASMARPQDVQSAVNGNPATLARDVGELTDRGWRLVRARPFHLFPHTGHVEVGPDPAGSWLRARRTRACRGPARSRTW